MTQFKLLLIEGLRVCSPGRWWQSA